ncbi:MAG TPA: carboxypeptidase regulatory-like domain-containing protein [Candidatus Krumholzibacteria bacterium]|nr:carboxypeptidase regulatory-like domain-containing protein [Candidatus Krumholzibacteria bacterium]
MKLSLPRLRMPGRRRSRPRWWIVLVPGLGLILTTAAVAGELHGVVHLVSDSGAPQQSGLDPYAGTLSSIGKTQETPLRGVTPRDVVVYLTGAPAHVAPAPGAGKPALRQINQSFEPHVLGVPVGTTVDFPNMDLVYHNVFSYSKTKRFDLGYYGKGKSRRVTFDKPGIVQVFCDIHSTMSAYVLVVDTPFVTQPGDDGAYHFTHLPNGTYTLKVWHPDLGERSMTVTVGDIVSTVDVNL